MSPTVEVGHVGVGLAKEGFEESELVVVHQVGDHLANFVRVNAISNVLAVSTAVNAPV